KFIEKFRSALKIGDQRTMTQLFKTQQINAIRWILGTCQRMRTNPTDDLARDLVAQKRSWEYAYNKSRFVSHQEEFWAFKSKKQIDELNGMATEAAEIAQLGRELLVDETAENRSKRIKTVVTRAAELAKAFEERGDKYQASEMYIVVADLSAPYFIPTRDANLGRAIEAFTKFLELRGDVELVDDGNKRAKTAIDDLERMGAVAGEAAPSAGIEFGKAVALRGEPEVEEEVTKLQRPSYLTDELYLTWTGLWLPGVDGTANFPRIDDGPTITRTSASSVVVVGTDGESQELSLSNRIQLVETTIGRGGAQRPWAFLLADPGANEFFHQVQMNMAAGNEGLALYAAPAASMTYEIAGDALRVFDDNLDGVYGGGWQAYEWSARGWMQPKEAEYQFDSMLVGRSKRAIPFSRLVQVRDQWYQLEPSNGGTTMRATPATLVTGKAKLVAKGTDFAWFIIEGEEELEGVRFDLAGARKGLEVPVGRYHMLSAGLREGKRQSIMKAYASPPIGFNTISVLREGETEFVAGAPFSFDCDVTVDEDEIVVHGNTLTVVGAGGERYHRIWNARNEPEVEIRAVGGRGKSVGAMQTLWSSQEVIDVGVDRGWKPLDLTVDNKFGDTIEIRFVEKKNDLFGKIEGEWFQPKGSGGS
ncbi:MAG: hypothetical protein AAFZ65_11730, partial [Planctomycetota bacterium]